MNIKDFTQQCLIHAPEIPSWFEPEREPDLMKIDSPDKTEWYKLLGQQQKQKILEIYETVARGTRFFPDEKPGTVMKDAGQFNFLKNAQLAGIDLKINEWYDDLVSGIEVNKSILLKHNMRKYFLWKRFYATSMAHINFTQKELNDAKVNGDVQYPEDILPCELQDHKMIPGSFVIPSFMIEPVKKQLENV